MLRCLRQLRSLVSDATVPTKAFLGVQIVVQFHFVGVCDKCRGDRSELGYTGNVCPYCEGTGEETIRTGHITARRTCTYCEGSR